MSKQNEFVTQKIQFGVWKSSSPENYTFISGVDFIAAARRLIRFSNYTVFVQHNSPGDSGDCFTAHYYCTHFVVTLVSKVSLIVSAVLLPFIANRVTPRKMESGFFGTEGWGGEFPASVIKKEDI